MGERREPDWIDERSQKHQLLLKIWGVGRWILLLFAVLGMLLICSQLALIGVVYTGEEAQGTETLANYAIWPFNVIQPVRASILEEIRVDEGSIPDIIIATDSFWPTPTTDMRTPTPNPSVTPTTTPIITGLPSLGWTNTPSPTVSPPVTRTRTPTIPAVQTSTPTLTRTPTYVYIPPQIPTRTNTRVPSRTPTRTTTRTLTLIPSQTLTPTRSATVTLTSTTTRTSTVTATTSATPTSTWTGTTTSTATVTHTATSSATVTVTQTPTPTDSPTPTDTATVSPTLTETDTPTVSPTPTDTGTPTVSPTPTDTGTPTETQTPTETGTPTATPTQLPLPPGLNIGPPDGTFYSINCGSSVTVDLGADTFIGTLVYYEREDPSNPGNIALDWVIVSLGPTDSGPWTLIFYWGDSNNGNNGSIQLYHYQTGEADNELIPFGELYLNFGILNGVGGTYRYVLISAPPGCGDASEVDAIEVLP